MKTTSIALLIAALLAPAALADSNGMIGAVIATETQVLGGPFDHGAAAGDASNGVTTAAFTGGFNATEVTITGDITGVIAFNGNFFFGEDDIIITDPAAGSLTWQNPAGTQADDGAGTVTSYTATSAFAAPVATAGTWGFEFFDTFDDGPGADSISDNVSVTLAEVEADTDTTGVWSLGSLAAGGSGSNVGEFLVGGIFDTYSLTATTDGFLTIETDEDPLGLAGTAAGATDTVDTELALFDAAGTLIAYSDDDGNGLYSLIDSFRVSAGDTFTVAVTGFGSAISAGGVGTFDLADLDGGTSLGDYGISASLEAIPEPSALSLLAIAGLVGFTRRRR